MNIPVFIQGTTYKHKEPIPKWKVGQKIGSLLIKKYRGFGHENIATSPKKVSKHLVKAQHWYEVKCDCGGEETMSQDQIRARQVCIECALAVANYGRTYKPIKYKETDFLRLPVPESITTKPEQY